MEGANPQEAEKLDINDPNLENMLVNELKAQGIFDQFRKDCLADVDTKPAYQNLKSRVEATLKSFIEKNKWSPGLNKNQLRNQLRKDIQDVTGKGVLIERIVDQIVDPKLKQTFGHEIESMIEKYCGSSLEEEEEEEVVETEDVDMADVKENGHHQGNGDNNGVAGEAEGEESNDSGPGLEGQISPITPGREESPSGAGNISPLTPATTPPLPQQSSQPLPPGEEMEVELQVELPAGGPPSPHTPPPLESYTPPPRKSTAVDHFTPPLPEANLNVTPPPPGPGLRAAAPFPPPPGESESGGDASMSSISDTEITDVSPPHRSPSSPPENIPLPAVSASPNTSPPPGTTPPGTSVGHKAGARPVSSQAGTGSDSDLDQLERLKAELMAKLEGDFKLSPEEDSDSEGEIESEDENPTADSPTSPEQEKSPKPDNSPSQGEESPGQGDQSPGQGDESPEQGDRSPDQEAKSPDQEAKSPDQEAKSPDQEAKSPDQEAKSPDQEVKSPDQGARSPDQEMKSPNTPPPKDESEPMNPTKDSSPPLPPADSTSTIQEPLTRNLSPVNQLLTLRSLPLPSTNISESTEPSLNTSEQMKTLFSAPTPSAPLKGPRTPEPAFSPDPEEPESRTPSPDRSKKGPTTPPEPYSSSPPSPPSAFSAARSEYWKPPSPKEVFTLDRSNLSTPVNLGKVISKEKKDKLEKKSDKIKEQQQAKLAKVEQKVKSKDKLKSDKYQDLDIFSTTKKPATPHLPYRPPMMSGSTPGSGTNSPLLNGPKARSKPNDYAKKLHNSIKEAAMRQDPERFKSKNEFVKPGKVPDRRGSSDSRDARDDRKSRDSSKHDSKSRKSSTENREKDRSRDKSKDFNKDRSKDKEREKERNKEKERLKEREKSKSRRESEEDKKSEINKQKERDSYYEESRKRLAEMRQREEKEKKKHKEVKKEEKDVKKEKKKDDLSKVKDQLSCLGVDEIRNLLLKTMAEKAGGKKIISELDELMNKKKNRKRKEIVLSDSEEEEEKIKPEKRKKVEKLESSDDDEVMIVSPPKETFTKSKEARKESNSTPTQKTPARKVSKDLKTDKSGDSKLVKKELRKEEKSEPIPVAKSAPKIQSDSDSVFNDIPEDKQEFAKENKTSESTIKKSGMKTRGVKVNINRLTNSEFNKYKETSSDSDSDFEVNVDHVETVSPDIPTTSPLPPSPKPRADAKPLSPKVSSSPIANSPKRSSVGPKPVKSKCTTPKPPAPVSGVSSEPELSRPISPVVKDEMCSEESTEERTPRRVARVQPLQKVSTPEPKPCSTPASKPTPSAKATPLAKQKSSPKSAVSPVAENRIPTEEQFFGFEEDDVQTIQRMKNSLDLVLDDEENLPVSSVSEEEINKHIPSSRTVEVDLPASCDTTGLLDKLEQLGGGARILHPIPAWLHPYIVGAKLKPDELELPSTQELKEYLTKNQKKAKKRTGNYDIVVEWVPLPVLDKKTKAERELKNDPFSTFFSGLGESGGKRARRANNRYSSAEYSATGELDGSASKVDLMTSKDDLGSSRDDLNSSVASQEMGKDEGRVKSSKERIKAYLKSAGVERSEVNSDSQPPGASPVEEAKPIPEAIKPESEACEPTAVVKPVKENTKPLIARVKPLVNRPSTPSEPCSEDKTIPTVNSAVNPTKSKPTRPSRRSKINGDSSMIDEPSKDLMKDHLDAELEATEAEMKAVLQTMINTKRTFASEQGEFYGWTSDEVYTPQITSLVEGGAVSALAEGGAKFGLEELDILGHKLFPVSSTEDSDLEVVMSPAIQRDIKKAEMTNPRQEKSDCQFDLRPDLLRSVKDDIDLRNGSDGSDSDDKGSSSPSSSGSSKENKEIISNPRTRRSEPFNINKDSATVLRRGRKRSVGGGELNGAAPDRKKMKL